jgi:uncharacterized protein with von Willebrand factor type A (vWA) domain
MSEAAGMLARNVMHFGRLLRRAGLPVGTPEILAGTAALNFVDLTAPADCQEALRAVMVHRREHQDLFDQAFAMFWRPPSPAGDDFAAGPGETPPPGSRRLAEALAQTAAPPPAAAEPRSAGQHGQALEVLRRMDFEAMSAADIARAKAEIRGLTLPLDARRTRRWRPDAAGRSVDFAGTIRRALRTGGEIAGIARRRRVVAPPPLVVLCDISGSMSRYAEILLHFLHAVANHRTRVAVFLFGTRLTNITRALQHRDPEAAFAMLAAQIPDWSGGTRIGEAVANFNRLWSRRVLGQGAVVLLVTDGLDREAGDGLAEAMARLHRSCRRLIWLNPLLRWDGFAPKTAGARAMLPHVDEFRPVHSLASLEALIAALSAPAPPRNGALKQWKHRT